MKLEGVLFLTGATARGKAYAQALVKAALEPEWMILYGEQKTQRPGQELGVPLPVSDGGQIDLFYPDLKESLDITAQRNNWHVVSCTDASVNSDGLVETIGAMKPRLIIFSGYGGELVGNKMLTTAPFLHVHSGWLPDYRGSTCGYYSLIEERTVGASAIILDEQIDTGFLLARRLYPPPPPGVDLDYLYDPAIRADLLVRVLREVVERGGIAHAVPQPKGGRTFYVIHPVLKHMALLSLPRS